MQGKARSHLILTSCTFFPVLSFLLTSFPVVQCTPTRSITNSGIFPTTTIYSVLKILLLFNGRLSLVSLSLGPIASSALKFQASNMNSGRARLVLFQGKMKHEVMGRSCPLGIALIQPQLFSCACVTGVWAFYDIMCAPPLQIIGGVNHCFKMPLDTYIQQVVLVSNPMRAHGDALSFFEGNLESVANKFFRNTYSVSSTPSSAVAVGYKWTLRSNSSSETLCLDASKHEIYESSGDFAPSAYCHFSNVSMETGPSIRSVSLGCKETTRKIQPHECFPFLEDADEDICRDVGLLEAYELAVEQENNDLSRHNKTREFKRLVKNVKNKKVRTTTASSTKTSKLSQSHGTQRPLLAKSTKNESSPNRNGPFHSNLDSEKRSFLVGKENSNLNSTSKSTANSENNNRLDADSNTDLSSKSTHDAGVVAPRKVRQSPPDSRELTPDKMTRIYDETVKNESNFLQLSGAARKRTGDAAVLSHVWTYQREEIKKALKFKFNESDADRDKSTVFKLLEFAKDIMSQQCKAVPSGFLNLALDTFIKVLEDQDGWVKPYTGNVDDILQLLHRCKARATPYNFVNPSQSKCSTTYPMDVVIGKRTREIIIPDNYRSDGFEPLIEAVWKTTVHALVFCHDELTTDVPAHNKLSINFHRIFTNQIHRIWFRKESESESVTGQRPLPETDGPDYGGVVGDTKLILKDLDICTTAASFLLEPRRLVYTRPPFKPDPGWAPPDPGDLEDRHDDLFQNLPASNNSDTVQIPNHQPNETNPGRHSRNIAADPHQNRSDSSMASPNLNSTVQLIPVNSSLEATTTAYKSTGTIPFSILNLVTTSPATSTVKNDDSSSSLVPNTTLATLSVDSSTVLDQTTIVPSNPSSTTVATTLDSTTLNRGALLADSTTEPTTVAKETTPVRTLQQNSSSSTSDNGTLMLREKTNFKEDGKVRNESSEESAGSESDEASATTPNPTENKIEELKVKVGRQKRDDGSGTANNFKKEHNWKKQRTIFGMAYCLKRFNEPKVHLGYDCD